MPIYYIGHFSLAVIKPKTNSHLQKKEFIRAYRARGRVSAVGEAWQLAARAGRWEFTAQRTQGKQSQLETNYQLSSLAPVMSFLQHVSTS